MQHCDIYACFTALIIVNSMELFSYLTDYYIQFYSTVWLETVISMLVDIFTFQVPRQMDH